MIFMCQVKRVAVENNIESIPALAYFDIMRQAGINLYIVYGQYLLQTQFLPLLKKNFFSWEYIQWNQMFRCFSKCVTYTHTMSVSKTYCTGGEDEKL